MILSLVLSRSSWNRIISERIQHIWHPRRLPLWKKQVVRVDAMRAGNEHRSMLSILSTEFYLDDDGITPADGTCGNW